MRRWAARCAEVIPIGVDAPALARTGPSRRGDLRALWVGRLVPLKRLDVLVEAVATAPGARLVVVGDGPERERLVSLARRRGAWGRVELRGQMPREDVWGAMGEADLLLLARAYEGLPHVAIDRGDFLARIDGIAGLLRRARLPALRRPGGRSCAMDPPRIGGW